MFGDGASAQISYQQYQMLQTLRRLSDQASYYWQKDVVGYDQDKQAASLLKWFNIRSITQQIIWLAASAITVMVILVFVIWQRRRKRWHPADQPLAQLSKRIGKADKSLARDESEGQLAWLERVAISVDDRENDLNTDINADINPDTNAKSSKKSSKVSKLTDSGDSEIVQAKIMQMRQDYRQLRYGRLSTLGTNHSEYQAVLKQLKKDASELF